MLAHMFAHICSQIPNQFLHPLGDPDHHPLWVYLPPGVDADPSAGYPSIYVLQGLTGQVDMWWNRPALRPTVPERIDALFSGGDVPPAVLDLGAGAFAAELDALGVEHTFELFDGGHMSIEYRYPRALAFLAERLAAA
jgi:hypothetical protein